MLESKEAIVSVFRRVGNRIVSKEMRNVDTMNCREYKSSLTRANS
jgi:hypothetical protein